jgi:hypothetical protein
MSACVDRGLAPVEIYLGCDPYREWSSMVGRIAPYQANNVQQSYLRQQRVGERIAGAKSKANSATQVEISNAARKAVEEAHAAASIHKQLHIEETATRFVEQYLEKPAALAHPDAVTQEGAENADGEDVAKGKVVKAAEPPNKGRADFVSLIESFGLKVSQDKNGEDQAIVNKTTGEDVVPLSNSTREAVKLELSQLVKNILGEVL